jgi:dTDP-4-amino-4,6-dideoxygalactose transaminase
MINIFQPSLGKEELLEISKVFESNWIGKGKAVLDFEKGFALNLKTNPSNFLSTTCCTEAIFLSMPLFNIGAGDEVIVPSISFISVGSAVVDSGAKLVLCDVNKRTLNVQAKHIEQCITSKTKAVFINHYGGIPCEMNDIVELCREKNILLFEDSACAVRSFYKGKACGTFGDMGMWSFDAMKTLCTGDGAMIFLKDENTVEVAKETLYFGLPNRQKSGLDSSSENGKWWECQINRPGKRAIMNNIAGAIGLVQLQKLDEFIERRKHAYTTYMRELSSISWLQVPPDIQPDIESSYYFFWIQLEKRDLLAKYLLDQEIYSTFRYWPLHKVDFFNYSSKGLDNSEIISQQTLNLPLHQSLSENDLDKVISAVKSFGKIHM